MKILFCCQEYFPKLCGIQKFCSEIAEHFAKFGHDVTVATGWMSDRLSYNVNGVKIIDFKIEGNLVKGLSGEVEAYQKFLLDEKYDSLFIFAAQQWSLDAMLPILHKIQCKKIHMPCGYSSFYSPQFKNYYQEMKKYLHQFDHLIFNSSHYRDIDFAKEIHHKSINIIAAGASELEFKAPPELDIRAKLSIPNDHFVFLTVGSPPINKGHKEIVQAFREANLGEKVSLVLNGDYSGLESKKGLKNKVKFILQSLLGRSSLSIKRLGQKNIQFVELDRTDLISLYFSSDLFILASKVEYSPLVIFEAIAAGLPFLSVPVGNTEEIIGWTNAGLLCPSPIDKNGFTQPSVNNLTQMMKECFSNNGLLLELSKNGRKSWEDKFTWSKIAKSWEELIYK